MFLSTSIAAQWCLTIQSHCNILLTKFIQYPMTKPGGGMMDPRFSPHNRHLDGLAAFLKYDPHLERLNAQPLVYTSPLLGSLPSEPGIYSVTGGRQVGKSTLLKQRMAALLRAATPPRQIAYFTAELIDDHHSLVRHLSEFIETGPEGVPIYIMLDEVTYCSGWDRAVKYLADAGLLRNVVLVLTGSDAVILRDARVRFPGRRGDASTVDFHLYPLSFSDTVHLKNPSLAAEMIAPVDELASAPLRSLDEEFGAYLLHGGYLTAINDVQKHGVIKPATYATYSDWIRGDMAKHGKQEQYLREILHGILKRYAGQITWNSLAKELSIDHPATIADYLLLLERMDAILINQALREDRLDAAPKKARKVFFTDPFILHAARAWLQPVASPFADQAQPLLADPEWCGRMAEACAVAHYHRVHPTFYIKAEGEVDIAYLENGRFWPIEVKWTGQIRPKDVKQIAKYQNGLICGRHPLASSISGIPAQPLSLNLFRLGPSPTLSRQG
jgi:predicted AAA+ superfamily ATPase